MNEERLKNEIKQEMSIYSEEELQEIRDSITDEERQRWEEEEEQLKQRLDELEQVIANAHSKKQYLEAIAEALREAFDEMADEVMVQSPDDERNPTDEWYLVWEGGSPFEWAIEFTGKDSWFGITGHQDNEKFYLEPHFKFSLSVGRR